MLTLYRDLIRLRITHRVLLDGKMRAIATEGHVLRYQRARDAETLLILLNFSHEEADATTLPGRIVHSTQASRDDGERIGTRLTLRPAEGMIVLLDAGSN
jgi:hypothetical protein